MVFWWEIFIPGYTNVRKQWKNKRKYYAICIIFLLIKLVKKRRFCGGRVTRFGVSRTQSSSRCSCHLPHPARLHFANWNTRQCRGCNISSPMRNAIFRSYKLWLDVFRVCTWACKCNASGRNSEKERGTICCRIDRSCNARKPSEHAGRITGRLHGNPWQTQSE